MDSFLGYFAHCDVLPYRSAAFTVWLPPRGGVCMRTCVSPGAVLTANNTCCAIPQGATLCIRGRAKKHAPIWDAACRGRGKPVRYGRVGWTRYLVCFARTVIGGVVLARLEAVETFGRHAVFPKCSRAAEAISNAGGSVFRGRVHGTHPAGGDIPVAFSGVCGIIPSATGTIVHDIATQICPQHKYSARCVALCPRGFADQ